MHRKHVGFVVTFLLFAVSALAQHRENRVYLGNLGDRAVQYVPGRVLVGFDETVSDDEAVEMARDLGASVRARRGALRREFRELSVPRGRVWQVIGNLRRNPRVRYAHPDWIAHATFVPNDPLYPLQWHLDSPEPGSGSIHVEGAWDVNLGGSPSVTVAVVDTGIAYETFGSFCQAPDLAGTQFVEGFDFVNGDDHPNDDHGHGTHVAGTIAQATHNGIGVAGIAFNTSLMPVKVLGANGSGSISGIANGIRWAADHGADIINMSLGTSAPRFYLGALEDAVQYAHAAGVLIVASSGNSSANQPFFPAGYDEVIAVGATRYDKQLASYSNRGNEVCAPGGTGDSSEDLNNDGRPDMVLQNTFDPNTQDVCDFDYWFFAGTSMAAPHVSGVAALIMAEDETLTHEEVRQVLRDTADKSVDSTCGDGLIDAWAALEMVSTGDSPPQVEIENPSAGAVVQGTINVQISALDSEDPEGSLSVEWAVDGGAWTVAAYNSDSGFYEAAWDTSGVAEDQQHTLQARATDSVDHITESVVISVTVNNDNDPPMADFTFDCSGSICDFDASMSADSDSSIVAYEWDFGDDQVGSGVTVRHTFTGAGTYPVTLTVTDDLGSSGSVSKDVEITEVTNAMHVADLDGRSRNIFFGIWQATVTITVRDASDNPVANAKVSGVFSDGPSTFACLTSGNGACQVVGYQWFLNCLTFTVLNVAHDTLEYRSQDNFDPDGDSDGTNITVCRP